MRYFATETQSLEQQQHLTGVQRVVTGLNDALMDELLVRGVLLRPMHTWDDRPRAQRPWARFLEETRLLQEHLISPESASLCLFLDWSFVNFPRLAKPELKGTPKIFFVHDVFPATHPEWFPPGTDRTYRFFLRQMLAVADQLVCSTEKVADDVRSLGWPTDAAIHVVGLGTHGTPREPVIRRCDRISLLYVSTFEPRKGHHLLLDVFDRLVSQGVDVELTLVGRRGWDVPPHWSVAQLTDRISRHREFGRRLRWFEGVDDATVRALGSRASIAVLPTQDEGFGLFAEEALAMGLKVVASAIPVFAERPNPNMTLAERTPQAMADAILATHGRPWVPLQPGTLRTLQRAACDLADLLVSSCPG
jgi:glycosyltransferase involved in cell wall biosynthesis